MLTSAGAELLFRHHVVGLPPRITHPNPAVTIFAWMLDDGHQLKLYLTTIPDQHREHASWRVE